MCVKVLSKWFLILYHQSVQVFQWKDKHRSSKGKHDTHFVFIFVIYLFVIYGLNPLVLGKDTERIKSLTLRNETAGRIIWFKTSFCWTTHALRLSDKQTFLSSKGGLRWMNGAGMQGFHRKISLLTIQRQRSPCYHKDLWKECSVL